MLAKLISLSAQTSLQYIFYAAEQSRLILTKKTLTDISFIQIKLQRNMWKYLCVYVCCVCEYDIHNYVFISVL